jgi:hypothetical protein
MLRTTQLSAEQSGLHDDVGDATVVADPIVTLSQDVARQKRAAAAKRQRASRANAKANKGVETISKKRKAEPSRQPAVRSAVRSEKEKVEPGRQPDVRSKKQRVEPGRQPDVRSEKQKLEPARRERLPPAPPSDLETANAALFLFLWCSFRLDLRPCGSTFPRIPHACPWSCRPMQRYTILMERYLHEAKQANIKADAAREVARSRNSIQPVKDHWAAAVARAKGRKGNAILAEAIRADIIAQADKEITATGGGEPQSDALAQPPSATTVLFGAAKPTAGLTAELWAARVRLLLYLYSNFLQQQVTCTCWPRVSQPGCWAMV